MFDPRRTPEQASLGDAVRAFAQSQVAPVGLEIDNAAQVPEPFLAALHGIGVLNPVPEEYGGQGVLSATELVVAVEELAAADAGLAYTVAMSAVGTRLIVDFGTDALKGELLPRIAADAGHRVGTLCFEGYGRGPAEFTSTASTASTGSAGVRVSGAKIAALWPGQATAVVVATDPSTGLPGAYLLAGSAGLVVARDDQAAGKLGLRTAPTGDVVLHEAAAVALTGSDELAVLRVVEQGRLALGAICLGLAEAALAYATRYATEREAFGQTIGSFQGVSFPLAELRMRITAARLAVLKALDTAASGQSADAISGPVTEAVWYAANVAVEAGRVGINTLGGHGFLQDHPVERWYRAATTISALVCDPMLFELEVL